METTGSRSTEPESRTVLLIHSRPDKQANALPSVSRRSSARGCLLLRRPGAGLSIVFRDWEPHDTQRLQLSYHYPSQSSFKRHQSTQPSPPPGDTNAPHTARGDGGRPPGFQGAKLPPRRRQRLRTARLTRRIQRLYSRTVTFLVRMVIALGHRHRLMAGEVVDLLDRDAMIQ